VRCRTRNGTSMITLYDRAIFGDLTVKERTGREVRVERLPRYTVWRGVKLLKQFRHRADAIRWAKVNA
jgi:hypothetical protein